MIVTFVLNEMTKLPMNFSGVILVSGVRRSIKDFRPSIVLKPKKQRRSLVKSLPNAEYTSEENLKVIKLRDKDSGADYVAEYHKEVREHCKPK